MALPDVFRLLNWGKCGVPCKQGKDAFHAFSAILNGGRIASWAVGAGTFEGSHRLETILHTPPCKVRCVTYTILLQPIFLSYCVYSRGQKKRGG